jgi:DNA-binding transcriptional MerR regulator
MYTVKQLAELAGVTVRALHHYDQLGLLKPTRTAENGYRQYDDDALLRLQQILFYREIGLELLQIKAILDQPDFDLSAALQSHRQVLEQRLGRLHQLIDTVDHTLAHLNGGITMDNKRKLFEGFDEGEQRDYERVARLEYGPDLVNDSIRRWNSYSKEQREAIMAQSRQIYEDLAAVMQAGSDALSDEVQAILPRWEDNIRHFYEPTLDIMRGLGETYADDPRFAANIGTVHPDLPDFMKSAITYYVDDLETAAIARMLADDEQDSATR